MAENLIISNARIVLENRVVEGSLHCEGGRIGSVGARDCAEGLDFEGDLLIPGLVELHTDNLEKHFSPRSGVEWDPIAAAISHDNQVIGSGITTVFDSLVLGSAPGWDMRDAWLEPMLRGLNEARRHGMLKADHKLHLRLEITHPNITGLLDRFLGQPELGLLSLMDHAPGDRQSPDIEAYKQRYRKTLGMDDAAVEAHVHALIHGSREHGPGNRQAIAAIARQRGLALASHDDASEFHIDEAIELGCTLTEFPTTMAAARRARACDLKILMGAPNLIRGGSHSGNIAAAELAKASHLDILSSDYIPSALIMAAFKLALEPEFDLDLPAAIATVSANPARVVGLHDRGAISPGLRADLVRVRLIEGRPIVRGVWVEGQRVN